MILIDTDVMIDLLREYPPAVALNLPLYTFNQKHYAAIPKLKTVQPYEKGSQK